MSYPAHHGRAVDPKFSVPAPRGRLAQPDWRPRRTQDPLTRKIEAASLLPDRSVRHTHHAVPEHPLFLAACTAFARGTLIQTVEGPVAVEDLLPGDRVICDGERSAPLVWIGSTLMAPGGGAAAEPPLTRVMAEAFGLGRPMPDLLAGPAARLLQAKPQLSGLTGASEVLTPIADFRDGAGVVGVSPPSAVQLYHVALQHHAVIRANGMEVESFHPGLRAAEVLGPNMRALFLSLFAHVRDFADFGQLIRPRVSRETLDSLTAA
ncbi:MAG: Hint domain-containing protein [Paracoccaceae bacterium]